MWKKLIISPAICVVMFCKMCQIDETCVRNSSNSDRDVAQVPEVNEIALLYGIKIVQFSKFYFFASCSHSFSLVSRELSIEQKEIKKKSDFPFHPR